MSSAGPGSEKKPETSPGANPAAAADAKTSLRDFSGLIALIGAGKMGGALLQGWLRLGLDPRKVIVIEPQALPYLSALAQRCWAKVQDKTRQEGRTPPSARATKPR